MSDDLTITPPFPSAYMAAESLYPIVYADTDAMGIVYHGKYLEIAERSRAHTVAAVGLDQRRAERDRGLRAVINKVRIQYVSSIRLHDIVRLNTNVASAGAAHIWWRTTFSVDNRIRATVEASTIFVSSESGEIVGIPDGLLETIQMGQREEITNGEIETFPGRRGRHTDGSSSNAVHCFK